MRSLCIALWLLAAARVAEAQGQDLGHRLPSSVGLDAGVQSDPGIYVGARYVRLASHEVHDGHGDIVPIEGFDLDVQAPSFGVAGTKRVGDLYLSAAVAVPIVRLSVNADNAEANVDRMDLGNLFVQPLKLGFRGTRFDVVGSYSFYAPTSQGARLGLARPQWSQELAAGGALFFDDRRGWRVTALGSYAHNHEKQGVRITRGDSVLIQGGFGGPVREDLVLGIAGYALWQVTDDRGPDLPAILLGARERAFGLGPDVQLVIPAIHARLEARLTWDIDGRVRPVGTILVIGLSFVAYRAEPPPQNDAGK